MQEAKIKIGEPCRNIPYSPRTSFMLWFSEALYYKRKEQLEIISNSQSNRNIEK